MINTMHDIDYTRSLPPVLKNDETTLALANVVAEELRETVRLSRLNIIYARIDELEESLLDILAYDLHIDWYEYDSPVEVKRKIIKESVKVHKRLGTKYAVERVVAAYFGSGEVQEWFEYDGKPHHFKVLTNNPDLAYKYMDQFLYMLDIVKRKSSWLDGIIITVTAEAAEKRLTCAGAFGSITTTTLPEWEDEYKFHTKVKTAALAQSITTTTLPEFDG